jgi:hypothetical protein
MVVLFLQCLSSLVVSVIGPYSWLLLSMCIEDNKLIREQQTRETNPLFKLARINTEQSEPNTD